MSKLHGAQLPVEAYDRDDVTKIASGKLLTIDNQIDTTTGTYKLKAVFNNDKSDLFPNQFVNIHLLVDTKRNVTIIPTPAIQRGPQGTYVYVVEKDNSVKIQQVNVLLSSSNSVGIGSGLQPGDVVVTDGTDKLQDGSKVETHTTTGGSTDAQGQTPPNPNAPATNHQPSSQSEPSPAQPTKKGKR
jgi:multidrug efflux system membrane fusion protein